MSTRYDDPEIARWMQPDPSQADGVRTYVYVGDDPLDFTDPSGLSGFCDTFIIGGIGCTFGSWWSSNTEPVYAPANEADLARLTVRARQLGVGADISQWTFENVALSSVGGVVAGRIIRATLVFAAGRFLGVLARGGEQSVVDSAAQALGCSFCFPAGTQVATPAGATSIAALHVGDQVLSENPQTGKVESEPVQAVISDGIKPLLAIALSDGSTITVTANHPFYVDRDVLTHAAGWLAAGKLHLGDQLRTPGGHDRDVTVIGVGKNAGEAKVYTLTVANDHTFFVGSARVLVHNSIGCINGRHFLSGIKSGWADKLNSILTVSAPEVETDLAEIQAGTAVQTGNRYLTTSGRTYVDKGNDTLFPESGPGIVTLTRKQYRVLQIYLKEGLDSAQAILNPAFTDADRAVAKSFYETYYSK